MTHRNVYIVTSLVVAIPVLIGLYYLFEDWLGSRSLAHAESDAAAHGINLTAGSEIPPPIPASQNLAAISLFAINLTTKGSLISDETLDFGKRLSRSKADESARPLHLPYLGVKFGEAPLDPAFIRARVFAVVRDLHPGLHPSGQASLTDLFDLICPSLPELRAANKTHPDCLFTLDYSSLIKDMNFSQMIGLIQVWKSVIDEQSLALIENNPDLAFEDYEVTTKVLSGIKKHRLLMTALICLVIQNTELSRMARLLDYHEFTDAQLARMDADLAITDVIALGRDSEEGELRDISLPTLRYAKDHRKSVPLSMIETDVQSWYHGYSKRLISSDTYGALCNCYSPNGAYDLDMSDQVKLTIEAQAVKDIDHKRIFPKLEDELLTKYTDLGDHVGSGDYKMGWVSFRSFAYAQSIVDEARIAFRLERYRLARGKYPESLDELKVYGDLPVDCLTGGLYIYRAPTGATYKLYSVGWNLKDDGGDPLVDHGKRDDPDWLWQNVQTLTK